jgi:hypothetical protein
MNVFSSLSLAILFAASLAACNSAARRPVASMSFAEVVALEKEHSAKCVTEAGPEGSEKHKACVTFYAKTEDARRAYEQERFDRADAALTATIESMRRSAPAPARNCITTGIGATLHTTCL